MVNKVILVGRLTSDPIIKSPNQNTSFVRFSLATNSTYTVNGQYKTKTNFVQCVVFNKNAEIFSKYTKKGSLLYVEGRIETTTYENNSGEKKYSTSVIVNSFKFLDSRNNSSKFSSDENANDFKDNSKAFDEGTEDEKIVFAEDIDWGENE